MVDPRRTGAAIAELRRARDWTQVELAERLHVTHQAVSRWENGDSFPDLALLYNLARLFDVGVDDLLAGPQSVGKGARPQPATGAVLAELAQGHPERVSKMVQEGQADLRSVAEAAPLVRPSQMEAVVKGLSGVAFEIDDLVALAPFVGK